MTEITHSFIIPAYNESERLTESIPKLLDYIHKRGLQGGDHRGERRLD